MTAGMGSSFDPDRIAAVRARLDKASGGGSRVATKQLWARAIAITLGFVALLYVIEGIDVLAGHGLDRAGIRPRSAVGLEGVAFAPLLHANWAHLMGNTLPVIVLGLLTLLTGIGRGLSATAIIWVVSGLGAWLISASGTTTVGASGLVFGWLLYLISRGLFARNVWQIVLGVVVGLLYGGILWGALPGQAGISWQAHLFGALGGLISGWVLSGDERRHRRGDSVGRLASP
ncbi:rhomboid family intramembrane serine protease [Nocardia miyunensis]|uniref:rhomboid family intramembrane serine protease n=1 Tax=Nocardia miyunensis TaxID=282684 RepID=UPI0009FE7C29|nr:rhomboid family intramembrane serine protease [Nocardia miyunensis]